MDALEGKEKKKKKKGFFKRIGRTGSSHQGADDGSSSPEPLPGSVRMSMRRQPSLVHQTSLSKEFAKVLAVAVEHSLLSPTTFLSMFNDAHSATLISKQSVSSASSSGLSNPPASPKLSASANQSPARAHRPSRSKKSAKSLAQAIPTFVRLPLGLSMTWSEIFHYRMLEGQNVLPCGMMEVLENLMNLFLEAGLSLVEDRAQKATSRDVEDFLSFAEWHRCDPDGALLGYTPSKPYLRTFHAHVSQYGDGKKVNDDVDISANDLTRDVLINLILGWSEIGDEQRIGRHVIKFANLLRMRTLERLKKGDLVMVGLGEDYALPSSEKRNTSGTESDPGSGAGEISDSGGLEASDGAGGQNGGYSSSEVDPVKKELVVMYGRFVESLDSRSIVVFTCAAENRTEVVNIKCVVPLSPEMHLMMGNADSMAKLVEDSVSALTDHLKEEIRALILEFLAEQGVDIDLLDRCSSNDISVLDLPGLSRASELLTRLHSAASPLLEKVEGFASKGIQDFRDCCDDHDVFLPTRDARLADLESWPFCALAKNRILRYIGLCDAALDQLMIEKRCFVRGEKKASLCDWWMGLIKKGVSQFLEDRGYEFDVIPPNYIDIPPRNLELITRNLSLLKEIMSPSIDIHNVIPFIESLRDTIYPRIDEFLDESRAVLVDQHAFPHGQTMAEFDDAEYMRALEEYSSMLTPELHRGLHNLVKDREYLSEMKKMESQSSMTEVTENKQLFLGVAVPVSGLAMGYFFRYENEHRTVLDVWTSQRKIDLKPRTAVGEDKIPLNRTRSRRAVSNVRAGGGTHAPSFQGYLTEGTPVEAIRMEHDEYDPAEEQAVKEPEDEREDDGRGCLSAPEPDVPSPQPPAKGEVAAPEEEAASPRQRGGGNLGRLRMLSALPKPPELPTELFQQVPFYMEHFAAFSVEFPDWNAPPEVVPKKPAQPEPSPALPQPVRRVGAGERQRSLSLDAAELMALRIRAGTPQRPAPPAPKKVGGLLVPSVVVETGAAEREVAQQELERKSVVTVLAPGEEMRVDETEEGDACERE